MVSGGGAFHARKFETGFGRTVSEVGTGAGEPVDCFDGVSGVPVSTALRPASTPGSGVADLGAAVLVGCFTAGTAANDGMAVELFADGVGKA